MIDQDQALSHPQTPLGLDHLVIRVRDIDESHVFWTECLGFKHVGTMSVRDTSGNAPQPTRFYSGQRSGQLSHHDIALVEDAGMFAVHRERLGLDHIAIEYASSAAWSEQLKFLSSRNVEIYKRVRRGATDSAHLQDPNGYTIELVCALPRELWESDINAALNKPPVFIE